MDKCKPTENPFQRSAKSGRMATLDGMRGIAALSVAIYHFKVSLMPSGYLAVDFFFLLSGFVLTKTYWTQLREPGALLDFCRLRAIRLLPIHLIGIALGGSFALFGITRHWPDAMNPQAFSISLALNSLMLPAPFGNNFFPLNPPAWSLSYEMIASLAMPALLIKISSKTLLSFCLFTAVALALFGFQLIRLGITSEPISHGGIWHLWYVGAIRSALSFVIGLLLASVASSRLPLKSGWTVLLLVALALTFLPATSGVSHLAYCLACILGIFPALLLLGIRSKPRGPIAAIMQFFGEISFPLYAVHYTIRLVVAYYLERRIGLPMGIALSLYLAISIALAWLIGAHIDPRIRKMLSNRFQPDSVFHRKSGQMAAIP